MTERAPVPTVDERELDLDIVPKLQRGRTWLHLARQLTLAATVALFSTDTANTRGQEPQTYTPQATIQLRLKEAGDSIQKLIKLLDHDDFDTRDAARKKLTADAIAEIKRTKKPYGKRSDLDPLPGDFPEPNRLLTQIRADIDAEESKLPLPDAKIFRAPEEWKREGHQVSMMDALRGVAELTGTPIDLDTVSIGFIAHYVPVDGLDGLTALQAIHKICNEKDKPRYDIEMTHGRLRVQQPIEIAPLHFSRASDRNVLTTIRIHKLTPNSAELMFATPNRKLNGWQVQSAHMVTPDGKKVPVQVEQTLGDGVQGPRVLLPPVAEEGLTGTLEVTLTLSTQDIVTENIRNLKAEKVWQQKEAEIRYVGIAKQDDKYVAEFQYSGGTEGFDASTLAQFGCTARRDGRTLQCVKMEKPEEKNEGEGAVPGKGKVFFTFDEEPDALDVHYVKTGPSAHRAHTVTATGLPLPVILPMRMSEPQK